MTRSAIWLAALLPLASALVNAAAQPSAPAELKSALKSKDLGARLKAVDAWTALGGEEAGKALEEAAKSDASPQLREAALLGLAQLRKQDAAAAFTAALEDQDAGVRMAAVRLLGKFGTEASAERLLSLAVSADAPMEAAILAALGEIGSPRTLAYVAGTAARARDELVAAAAVEALGRILERTGAVAALKRQVEAGKPGAQASAALALARLGNPAGLPACLKLLEHKDRALRRKAAEALGELEAPAAAPALEAAAAKELDPGALQAMQVALRRIGRRDAQ